MNRSTIYCGMILALWLTVAGGAQARNQETPAQPSAQDKSFLQQVAQENKSEIDLAKLALQKSSDAQVRQYAQGILSSDAAVEKNEEKLSPAATQPATSEESAEYQKLARLSSRDFDEEYMQYEATRQRQNLGLLENEISTTDDANLLDFGIKAEVPTQDAEREARTMSLELGGSLSAKDASPRR